MMNDAKQAKYILRTFTTRNPAADSDKCILVLGGTSRNLRGSRRIGIEAPIASAGIPAKLAAFAAALTMNGLLAAGVAYLFHAPLERHTTPLEQHTAAIAASGADKPQLAPRSAEEVRRGA